MQISNLSFKANTLKAIIITILCFVFYGNTIPNRYALDDGIVITENKFTKNGLAGLPDIFKHDFYYGCFGPVNYNISAGGRYRPLPMATYAIEYQFFGENPHISHFINILFLVLASLILYKLISKLFSSYFRNTNFLDIPFVTALLFIAHPVHTEIVANIKGRDEIMVMIGALATVLFILKYIDTKRYMYLVMSFVSFFLALLSKENAITFLVIIPFSIYFYKKEKWNQYLISLIPVCLATVVFLVIRLLVVGKFSPPADELLNNSYLYATISEKFATISYTLGLYIKLLFWPNPLTYDYYPYHIKLVNWNNLVALLSLLVYLALGLFALLKLAKKTVVSYGILFYMITLSIASNVFFPVGPFMSERFIFIPSIGFLLIIAWLLTVKIPGYIQVVNIRIPLLIVVLSLCFFKTYSRNQVWRDNVSLFTTDVKTSSNGIIGNMFAARMYLGMANQNVDTSLKRQYLGNALKYSKKAASLYPNHVDVVTVLADAYAANNIPDTAIFCYKKAVYLMPDRADFISKKVEETMNNINNIDFIIGNYIDFLKLAPNNFDFNFQTGCLVGQYKNDFPNSGYYLQRAVEIRPDDFNANMVLGINFRILGEYDKSYFYLDKALKLNPGFLPIYENLLITCKRLGNIKKVEEIQNRIIELKKAQK